METIHAFGENGEISRGAQQALSAYATRAYVNARVFPVGMGDPIPSATDLPLEGDGPGDARLAIDTMHLWVWDSTSSTWLDMGTVRGEPVSITAGTATTLPPGSEMTFVLVGTEPNYTLNIGLPQGAKGAQGDTGDTGAGVKVLGVVAGTGDLPTTGNSAGDAYIVGGEGGDLYVWSGTAWQNAGPLGASDWADITDKPATFPPSAHNHTIAQVNSLQTSLDAKVPTSRTVNGKALTGNVTLAASDVGAVPSSVQALLPFVNSWTGSAWTYTTLTAAQAAGLATGQIVWHIGGTAAPSWARAGDVWTTGS